MDITGRKTILRNALNTLLYILGILQGYLHNAIPYWIMHIFYIFYEQFNTLHKTTFL